MARTNGGATRRLEAIEDELLINRGVELRFVPVVLLARRLSALDDRYPERIPAELHPEYMQECWRLLAMMGKFESKEIFGLIDDGILPPPRGLIPLAQALVVRGDYWILPPDFEIPDEV